MFISSGQRNFFAENTRAVALLAREFANVDESPLDSVRFLPGRLHHALHMRVSGRDVLVKDVLCAVLKHTGLTLNWQPRVEGKLCFASEQSAQAEKPQ